MATNNNKNENAFQPLLVGIIMVLITLFVRQLSESNKDQEGWFLPNQTSSTKRTKSPQALVEEEWKHIERYKNSGTQIINSFVQDKKLLERLANKTLWEECNNEGTRWFDKKHNSKNEFNIWQELAKDVWSSVEISGDFVGYEYWCNILSPTTHLDWHVDKDEDEYARSGQLSHPVMGAVYYGYPHVVTGGHLELLKGDASQTEFESGREAIRPEYNRLVVLNVSQWHRVEEISSGERYTFAVNIWNHKPSGL